MERSHQRIPRTPEDQDIIRARQARVAHEVMRRTTDLGEYMQIGCNVIGDYVELAPLVPPKPHAPKENSPWRQHKVRTVLQAALDALEDGDD